MKIAILAEADKTEARVAASPDSVKKLVGLGADVAVVAGAGDGSNFSDGAFSEAGASIARTAAAAIAGADVILSVRRPESEALAKAKKSAIVVGNMDPYGDREGLEALAAAGPAVFSVELMPRITRAQSMDVLSSQSNLAGYKAVIDAAATYGRAMPMMMTAAGTIAPARVFVMGAGVAGLQAIATARRLGAIVSATDVRPVAKEQVESLGATFVMVESDEVKDAETAGGYAKEMSEDYKRRQAELVAEHIRKQDIVITTALIPGRPAPRLITKAMVESMKPGSIIVDLAVERGGNVEVSKPGKVVAHRGVTIIGHLNTAGRLAADASGLYARNLVNFLTPLVREGALAIDWDDEIVTGTLIARGGALVHPMLAADGPAGDGREGEKA
jgi:NAD(P) transhydrogenase subunit alpha